MGPFCRLLTVVIYTALLCPLKHPSELPTHPSLSQPYTSEALERMTVAVEEKLRQERSLLWRARTLHQQFLGDGGWVPCGALETVDDRWIFEPRMIDVSQGTPAGRHRQSRIGTPSANGAFNASEEAPFPAESALGAQQTPNGVTGHDVEMAEIPQESALSSVNNDPDQIKEPKSEEAYAPVNDLPPHPTRENDSAQESKSNQPADENEPVGPGRNHGQNGDAETRPEGNETHEDETEQDAEMHDGSSPEPPRRMTTRAQANATHTGSQSPISSADTSSTFPIPHPLFLTPNVLPDANFGLPASEAEETRRLLWSYIQKQEETVRGFEHMLDSLLRACQMKAKVLEWCKAEGHVGEMSDGEDWYDREEWGLGEGEDLKKGTDEDEVETVDESRTTAKRGRGRRA